MLLLRTSKISVSMVLLVISEHTETINMSWTIIGLINMLIDILNIKAVMFIYSICNESLIQHIKNMKHKWIHLTFSNSILYENIKNLMTEFRGKKSLVFQSQMCDGLLEQSAFSPMMKHAIQIWLWAWRERGILKLWCGLDNWSNLWLRNMTFGRTYFDDLCHMCLLYPHFRALV